METGLGLFLLSVAVISLITGVMLPGPMTAATIAKGYGNKHAGALIAAGHGIVELPLIAAIYLGLGHFLKSPPVFNAIYIAGELPSHRHSGHGNQPRLLPLVGDYRGGFDCRRRRLWSYRHCPSRRGALAL